MAKKILIGVAGIILLLLIVIATRPATYHVERSVTIAAPASAVFPWVADLHKFGAWSPWAELDPEMKVAFEGPETGVGSIYRWDGNDQVGAGSLTVTAYVPNEKVAMDLIFLEPFASAAKSGLQVAADGEGATKVTWSLDGDNNFMGKAMSLVMDMDTMIGADYEKGLAKLGTVVKKSVSEVAAAPAAGAADLPTDGDAGAAKADEPAAAKQE